MKKILTRIVITFLLSPLAMLLPVSAAVPNWNVTGSYVINMDYLSTNYAHDMSLTQDGSGNLTGGGGYPAGGPHTYTWVLTGGTVTGNAIEIYANYTSPADAVTPLTVMHMLGTVAPNGTMSGTWSDDYQGGVRTGTWATATGTAVALTSNITVTAENFNTNKGPDYYGATVGYALGGVDAGKVASVSVSLFDASNTLLVTNTSKSAAKVNNTLQGPHYSSAFLVQAGTYATSSMWNFGPWTPKSNVIPAKAVITVTDINGFTYTAENSAFQASEPSHPTWVSLFSGALTAEDFGVVNYDAGSGLGFIKGYTAGFGLTDATFASTTGVVVKLYSAGNVLLQTNTAILPKFNADITGTQFSSPFDVSGSFAYAMDGYWTNVREAQFGESVPATKVVATVTLANGNVVIAENTLLSGDPTTIYPTPTTPATTTVKVTIDKFIDGVMATAGNASSSAFPMSATWDATNTGAGTGAYTLSSVGFNSTNAYEAVTSQMTTGASYSTFEVTGGTVVGATCSTGQPYTLVGYSTGDTLSQAQVATTSLVVPSFTGLTGNKVVIVWNKVCVPTPLHISPANNSTTTSAMFLKADWTDVTDVVGGITYTFQFSHSSTTNPDGSFATTTYTSSALSASEIPTTGTPAGVYYWHVRATDADGNVSAWSNAWKITVTNAPVITSPANKDQCKNGGWSTFNHPIFKNQGQCVSFVENLKHNDKNGKGDKRGDRDERKENKKDTRNEKNERNEGVNQILQKDRI